jgi:hypothetical protein
LRKIFGAQKLLFPFWNKEKYLCLAKAKNRLCFNTLLNRKILKILLALLFGFTVLFDPPLCSDFSVEKAGYSMTFHDMAKPILLKSFYCRQFPFISKIISIYFRVLSSPVMTIYLRVFPKNGAAP